MKMCGICGEPLPPSGQRFYFTLGTFGEHKSEERFCSEACAETEREHAVEEIDAGLVTLEEIVEMKVGECE